MSLPSSLRAVLERFKPLHMLVLGDVILDRYWWGDAHRLSPEAPVPVVRKVKATVRAGGAANTAANIVALGARASLCGVVGRDHPGSELRGVLGEAGIGDLLVEDPSRPTTSKTRVIAGHQQVVRVDEEDTAHLAQDLEVEILSLLDAKLSGANAVVVSDYAKGFLTPLVLRGIIERAAGIDRPVFVDPKGSDYRQYLGCTLLKPNRLELGVLTRRPVTNHRETQEAGRELAGHMPGTTILVTEGAEGMTAFLPGGSDVHISSAVKQVFDVTGAGDTVLATVALALSAGATHPQALDLAVRAASIAVGVVGTSAVTHRELLESLG